MPVVSNVHWAPHPPVHFPTHSLTPPAPGGPQVCRTARNEEAVMAIGVDNDPSEAILAEISSVKGIMEHTLFKEMAMGA